MDARNYFESETLDDGRDVIIRALRPDDKQALQEGFSRLSEESAYYRFFRIKRNLSNRELTYFTELDFDQHVAIGVAIKNTNEYLPIGVGRYIVDQTRQVALTAEFAITVADAHQDIGVGSLLLKHLIRLARFQQIKFLVAHILAQNAPMVNVVRECGLPVDQKTLSGVTEMAIQIK